jgi:hypothetical protein
MYDCTTLHFETGDEDELRKVGMSKEHRVDPQVQVGLLVDPAGFPLEVHLFEGNTAETTTLLSVLRAFQERHGVTAMVVVADAGMLSAANLNAIEDAGFCFIVGSRIKGPLRPGRALRPDTGTTSPMDRSSNRCRAIPPTAPPVAATPPPTMTPGGVTQPGYPNQPRARQPARAAGASSSSFIRVRRTWRGDRPARCPQPAARFGHLVIARLGPPKLCSRPGATCCL